MLLLSESKRGHLLIRRNELQKVANLALQNAAQTCQHVNVQSRDCVVAVVVQLSTLHLRSLTELIFADTSILNQFRQVNPDRTVFFHSVHHPQKVFDRDSVALIDLLYKL